MQPIVNRLEDNYQTQVTFLQFNALDDAEGEQLFTQLSLPGHPSILIYNEEGNQVYRGIGIIDEGRLEQEIVAAIQNE